VKTGSGTLTLSGSNSYTGGTTINGGTLQIGNGGSILGNVTDNSIFAINRSDAFTFGGAISGTGAFQQNGSGTTILTGVNSYGGGTTINGGTLQIGNGGSILGNVTDNSIFAINRSDAFTFGGAISGTGAFQQNGAGTTILTGVNSYGGGTTINAGALQASADNNLGNANGGLIFGGGALKFGAAFNLANTRAITLNASGGTFDTNSFNSTVSQGITGAGSLTKTGTGTLSLSGTNAYAGGTTINGGTLQLGNGGTTGSILGNVTDNSIFAINRSDAFTFGGVVSGSGAFQQNGAGTTILTGTNNYTGATTVNAGTLQVDGALTGTSGVTVTNGATLGGIGSVRGTTINNGGTLMAGSASLPGTFTINGNLTMGASANYVVFVNPTTFGKTLVNGTATLGGTAFVNAANGVYHAGQFTLLTASGGLGGTTFAALNTLGFGFSVRNARLAYDANDVYLLLDPGIISPSLAPGASNNQKNVAGGVDNAILGGATPTTPFSTLLGLSGAQLGNALDQVSGEASGGVAQAGMQMTTAFLTLMLNPFGGAPGGNPGALGFARGFGAGEQALSPEAALAYAAVTPKDKRVSSVGARWGFWGGGFGGYNTTNGDAMVGSHDTSARTYGFAAGADYRLAPDTMVGFALAGGGASWGLSQNLGGGRSDVFQIGLYGSKQFGAAYVSAAASYGWHNVTTDRTVMVAGTDKLDASFNAHSFGARLESGYRFMTPVVGITPYAALQVQNFRTPSYSENAVSGLGTFALSYNGRSTTATRAELGAWFDKLFALDGGKALSVRARAAWAHDHSNNPGIGAVFQTLPGSNFAVNGAAAPSNSALLSAGAELRLANNVSFGGKFDGEFANGSRTYTGTGTVRYVW
jgi:outer membrane autotransporter protein